MARAKTSLIRVSGTEARNRLRKYCHLHGLIMSRIAAIAIDEYIERNTAAPGQVPRRRKGDKAA